MRQVVRRCGISSLAVGMLWLMSSATAAQAQALSDPEFYGPYNASFLPDGAGLTKPLAENDTVLQAGSPWSLYCWVKTDGLITKPTLVFGLGDLDEEYPRYLALEADKIVLWMGKSNNFSAPADFSPMKWHFVAATFDGTWFRLYSNGSEIGQGNLTFGTADPVLQLAPAELPWPGGQHFGGEIAYATLLRRAMTGDEVKRIYQQATDFSLLSFEEGSKPWPVQTRGQAGYRAPQDPATMPTSRDPIPAAPGGRERGEAIPKKTSLAKSSDNAWTIGGWELAPAPKLGSSESGASLTGTAEERQKEGVDTNLDGSGVSTPAGNTHNGRWMPATVPGTVLTTMIDQLVYPDPDYGLNNLRIPESLNKQDYWYRTEFEAPAGIAGRRLTLVFQGINYKAEVWLNGKQLGTIKGAFIRGVFDVTDIVHARNVLAVKISPPPHPGIPQEQSIKGGPGENGGLMCLDGPTFVATEGWDWIPAIRDRDTGIWQPVTLLATGAVKVGDPQIVTTLPLPDITRASLEIAVPLENASSSPVKGTLRASFDQTNVEKSITVPPGGTVIKLTPAEFSQLVVSHPRLWWPNGYGKPELYTLNLTFSSGGEQSDSKQVKFGIRQITYELSLLDSTGHLRRLEFDPSRARMNGEKVVDVSHDGMREVPSLDPLPPDMGQRHPRPRHSWVASLLPGAESSSSVRMLEDTKPAPYLVVKVNGVRIACRGGNWGMDDSRKRVSRARLEPYFRLHREANLNIIRNWVGQNTEEVFYDLADEYGLLVWNDFWESTQNYNVEAEDPALFLENARDVILRFRNHPSILLWCGRNEGVPQPILNQGLEELTRTLDGTRYYSPSSNQINLQDSGPYQYKNPALYYTTFNRGFSVETGTPSMSTLESFRAWIPKEDQWPISDAWAYHDWHQSSNGNVAPFMAEIQSEFGAPTSLEDFERKAQMLNYVTHRAIFEGMNRYLWAPNSGRLLWMTQPAWPSTVWQILSSDYDTQASFYGVKKACESVHVQLDLSDYTVSVVNTTREALSNLSVIANVYSLDSRLLLHREGTSVAGADSVENLFSLDLATLILSDPVIVKLELRSKDGRVVSDNVYWLAATSSSYRRLNTLPDATIKATGQFKRDGQNVHIRVQLENQGATFALAIKLTPVHLADGSRILPAYLNDNYISLLPKERREIEIEYPAENQDGAAQIAIRGWNLGPRKVPLTPEP